MTDARREGKRILGLVCHRMRDLPALVYLKVVLKERYGHELKLAGLDTESQLIPEFKPHLILLPWLERAGEVRNAAEWKAQGIGVGVIPIEGYSFWEVPKLQRAGKYADLRSADLYFVWNEETAQLAVDHATLPADRLHVAGVGRFDFYREPLKQLLMSKETFCRKHGLDPNRPLITLATNFCCAQMAEDAQALQATKQWLRDAKLPGARLGPYDSPEHAAKVERISRGKTGEALLRLSKDFPAAQIVLKPHPGESSRWYESLIQNAGCANVRLITTELIWDLLNATDLHLHRTCTTAVESWLLNKPTIDLHLNPDDVYTTPEFEAAEDVATTPDDLCSRVAGYLAGAPVPERCLRQREILIRKWFYAVDGNRTLTHATVIDNWLRNNGSAPRITPSVRNVSACAKVKLRRMLGLEPHESLLSALPFRRRDVWGDKGRYFTSREAADWERRIRGALSNNADAWDPAAAVLQPASMGAT